MKLNVKAFALASGVLTGLAFFGFVWWLIAAKKHGHMGFGMMGAWHRHKKWISPLGSIFGLLWGMMEGMIAGALFAWIYNAILMKKAEEKKMDWMAVAGDLIGRFAMK